MYARVKQYIERNALLAPYAKVIVAISGGADSVALLHLLRRMGFHCIAAHCNFHLRGDESMRDETFVRELCATWQVPLHTVDFDTQAHALRHKQSVESAARELRYGWFEELRRSEQAAAIAVAHHADDQSETILMHLVRGSGLHGLCGMSVRNGHVIRPLLETPRDDIERYLRENNLAWVDDSTNADTVYRRNKFRHEVLPLLRSINPDISQVLLRTASCFRDYAAIVDAAVRQVCQEVVTMHNDEMCIHIAGLCARDGARALLYELLSPYGFNGTQVDNIFTALAGQAGKTFDSSTHRAEKGREHILVYPLTVTDAPAPHLSVVRRSRCAHEQFPSADAPCVWVDAGKIHGQLTLRHWQEGDTFHPIGLKGTKKLSDFFTDMKLSLHEKQSVWLLTDERHIIWIVGHRMDDRYKITPSTQLVAEITLQ